MTELAEMNAELLKFAHELEQFEAQRPGMLEELEGIESPRVSCLRFTINNLLEVGRRKLRETRQRFDRVRGVFQAAAILGVKAVAMLDACVRANVESGRVDLVAMTDALVAIAPNASHEQIADAAMLVFDVILRLPEEPVQ